MATQNNYLKLMLKELKYGKQNSSPKSTLINVELMLKNAIFYKSVQ